MKGISAFWQGTFIPFCIAGLFVGVMFGWKSVSDINDLRFHQVVDPQVNDFMDIGRGKDGFNGFERLRLVCAHPSGYEHVTATSVATCEFEEDLRGQASMDVYVGWVTVRVYENRLKLLAREQIGSAHFQVARTPIRSSVSLPQFSKGNEN